MSTDADRGESGGPGAQVEGAALDRSSETPAADSPPALSAPVVPAVDAEGPNPPPLIKTKDTRKTDQRRKPAAKIPPLDVPLAVVRYGRMRQTEVFRHNLEPPPPRGRHVIIRTTRGVELGQVVSTIWPEGAPERVGCTSSERFCALLSEGKCACPYSRPNRILRLATSEDINDQVHLDQGGADKLQYCATQLLELKLKMRLVAVEHLFGGERVIFYFTAEGRVDFRELVRRLAGQYRTRIEMRQIGARDEARLVADYERCGQRCCCQQFLGELEPVSIRMAKTQKATLDPTKISGRCGRLMCCLRYEDQTYEQLRRRLPRKNTWVRTESLTGRVIGTETLAQLVKVVDIKGAVSVIEVDAIIERGVPAPTPPPERPPKRRKPPAPPKSPPADKGDDKGAQTAEPAAKSKSADRPAKTRGRKRRRGRRKTGSAANGSASNSNPSPAPQANAQGDAQTASGAKKNRRRRRRKKRRNGGANGDASAKPPQT